MNLSVRVARTDEPAIWVLDISPGNLDVLTELEPGEADIAFTSLADLRNAIYDLDVDIARALHLPDTTDLDDLLEQLRDATRLARTSCSHPACESHRVDPDHCARHAAS